MARPELCVLLAYAKRLLRAAAARVEPARRPVPRPRAARLLPAARSSSGSAHLLGRHALRRELVATIVANDVVNSMGITFVRAALRRDRRRAGRGGARLPDRARGDRRRRPLGRRRGARRHDGAARAERADGRASTRWSRSSPAGTCATTPSSTWQSTIDRDSPGSSSCWATCRRRPPAPGGWSSTSGSSATSEAEVPDAPARFGAAVPDLIYAPDVIAVARESGRVDRRGGACLLRGRRAAVPEHGRGAGRRLPRQDPLAAAGLGLAAGRPAAAAPPDRGPRDRAVRRLRHRQRRRGLPGGAGRSLPAAGHADGQHRRLAGG